MTIHTRFTTFVAAAIATITLSSTHATAQPYIEIDISGTVVTDGSLELVPFGLRAVFDAGAAPHTVDTDTVRFNAVWGEAVQTGALTNSSVIAPFVLLQEPLEYLPADVELQYVESAFRYQMSTDINGENIQFWVDFGFPGDAWGLSMTSLPDAPIDYQMPEWTGVHLYYYTIIGHADWREYPQNGIPNNGTILVRVSVVDGPPEPECIADINGDGELNFFDISAYIALFSSGCPD